MGRPVDEETQHYIRIRRTQLARLRELDNQAAAYGKYSTPPHIEMERTSLREELGMVETAIKTPARAEIVEQLGPSGRFLVNHEQNREIKQSIAALAVQIDTFITQSMDWRAGITGTLMQYRQWFLLLAITILFVVVIVVAYIAYSIGRGWLP